MDARPENVGRTAKPQNDPVNYDVIVIGSGAAGLSAAVVAACEGQRVLVVEKTDRVGGTTAISGGMVWVPANSKMAAAGRSDSLDQARTYLDATVPKGLDPALREAFLKRGNEAIDYLESHSEVKLQPVVTYPDYYPDQPGAVLGARVLESVPFDAGALGPWFSRLRSPLPDFMLLGGMMVSRADIPHWRRFAKSPRSAMKVIRLVAQYLWQRTRHSRGTTLYLGNALVGRLLLSAIKAGVVIETETEVLSLLQDGAAVIGIRAKQDGTVVEIGARKGVILATGGFSHDPELRRKYLPQALGEGTATIGSNSGTGGLRLGLAAGGTIAPSQGGGFWVPASPYTDADGNKRYFPHTVTDRGKPGLIAVNRHGVRFTNEARSYHEFVKAQIEEGADACPAWLVCDAAFLWKYGLGRVKPFSLNPSRYVREGYLFKAASLDELAQQIGLPTGSLSRTVAAFNKDAKNGVDPEFGRGGDAYQRHLGDADVKPNPCIAPILKAPFFAVPVYPADLGTAAGLTTSKDGEVLGEDGKPIAGLYACGNDMASIMNGAYPGPGITIGPAVVFGYIVGRHCAAR
ncbi:FAD-dependent oxidoreductase [Neorhizobium sp. NCHU2750]|uniref:FAD-dependent oxidoreductase n=1 Tax=Neorhizobium sp. NCHU2750 TaxID=1825976 RepID=UPI000E76C8C2|nr:succinate dehydrogenase [Neorhizobium sp. NCHU2750]